MHTRLPVVDKMESAAPYDTSFTPEYRLKIIGGKPTYVPDYSNRRVADRPQAPPPQSLPSSGGSSRSSADKRNTWTSHSVLPPILSPDRSAASSGRSSGSAEALLPSEPITLNKAEEIELVKSIGASLHNHDMEVLKLIYNEVTAAHDQNLTGWVMFSDVSQALLKCQVSLQIGDLRTASAMFVSPERPGYVNYERLLSFLASAIKFNNSKRDHPQYFAQSGEKQKSNLDFLSINTRAPRPPDEVSGAQGKLIRLVEDQLAQGEVPLDIEKLRNQFTLADRLHRDSLSHGEIKEICYRNRVPLQESVINHVLDRCRTTGDGQYRWTDFIDFLEKVQPTGTGLNITSKQPLEYVKKLPEPNNSWPRPEFADSEPPSTYKHNPRMSQQEQTNPQLAQLHNNGRTTAHRGMPNARDSRENPITAESAGSHRSLSQQSSANQHARAGGVQMHSDAVQTDSSLGRADDLLPKRLQQKDGEESWLDRFGKLAQALYRNDLDKSGVMKADECNWLISKYNDIYGLNIPKDIIDSSIQTSTNHQGTNIDSILKELLQSAQ